jgi:hypothetical protein
VEEEDGWGRKPELHAESIPGLQKPPQEVDGAPRPPQELEADYWYYKMEMAANETAAAELDVRQSCQEMEAHEPPGTAQSS